MAIDQSGVFPWNREAQGESNPAAARGASRTAQMDDLRCVAAVRRGEVDAFGEIVRRYQDRLFNAILRLMGDWQEARDLTQQAFLKAYVSLERFRGDSSFYTWLYRIAVNVTLDARKKRAQSGDAGREGLSASGEEDSRYEPASSADDDPARRALAREREEAVTQAIKGLDDLHRSILVLRDIEGMDYEEIASVLSIPRGTVKSRLHRARMELRDKLKGLMS
jgi:RNA polymerase sigma-70 factor, ECF subfamily